MPSHRPGARTPQWSVGYYLRRDGRPDLPPPAVLTPTVVGAGLVACASAGLLTVVLTGHQQQAAAPTPSGDGLATGVADPAKYTRPSSPASTQAPGTAAAPEAPPTILARPVNGSSGAGRPTRGGPAGSRPLDPLQPWTGPVVGPPGPAPPAGAERPLAAGPAAGAEPEAGDSSAAAPDLGPRRISPATAGPDREGRDRVTADGSDSDPGADGQSSGRAIADSDGGSSGSAGSDESGARGPGRGSSVRSDRDRSSTSDSKDSDSDGKDSDGKDSDSDGKRSDGKRPDGKGSDGKGSDGKHSGRKGSDGKHSGSKGSADEGSAHEGSGDRQSDHENPRDRHSDECGASSGNTRQPDSRDSTADGPKHAAEPVLAFSWFGMPAAVTAVVVPSVPFGPARAGAAHALR